MFTDIDTLNKRTEINKMASNKQKEAARIIKLLKDPAANTHIRFIRDVEGACEAAKGLVADGVTFIELCSWFDAEKTNAVIKAIDCQVPVGSCGL